ncbi:hypothetical protein Tco_1404419 [Tanacetum coccineum]
MGGANPIRTLVYYSKPSHHGYRNIIELLIGSNVVPLRSDTIWLVQNGFSFHELRSDDPNQHLKGFLKLVDSLDLDENAWATIKKLAQYEDEGWNHPVILEEGNLDYKNPDIEHLLGVTEYKVDRLMKDALSLMGRSEGIFRMTSNERLIVLDGEEFTNTSSQSSPLGKLIENGESRELIDLVILFTTLTRPISRKAYLLEDKANSKCRAFGWHLEEIHVTWAHLAKKRTRLRLYTKSFEESSDTKAWRRRLDLLMRDVMDLADGVRT